MKAVTSRPSPAARPTAVVIQSEAAVGRPCTCPSPVLALPSARSGGKPRAGENPRGAGKHRQGRRKFDTPRHPSGSPPPDSPSPTPEGTVRPPRARGPHQNGLRTREPRLGPPTG